MATEYPPLGIFSNAIIEPKTNMSKKISNQENYDDGSKNLANFFNGEIIDIDE